MHKTVSKLTNNQGSQMSHTFIPINYLLTCQFVFPITFHKLGESPDQTGPKYCASLKNFSSIGISLSSIHI